MHHILMFPLPIQGPVKSMLKLAELILFGFDPNDKVKVTFLTTEHVHKRLDLQGRHPNLCFHVLADGLPVDHPRGGDKFLEMLETTEKMGKSFMIDMLSGAMSPPITCVIADGLFTFVLDVGQEFGTPVMYFDTISPCCLWVYLCLSGLIQDGVVPFQDEDDMEATLSIPGMENLLRRRDFPDFCRANNLFTTVMMKRVIEQANQFRKAQGIILNSFESLEESLLCNFNSHLSNPIYVVGPLHLHLKERITKTETVSSLSTVSLSGPSNSLWREDRNCLKWLDQQHPQSVIFCSFGSQVVITKDQLVEFWFGLVDSKTRFLWVSRPGSVVGLDDGKWNEQVPSELVKGVEEYGFVTSWVPQEEVLNHGSIGGFLTHSGWNSVIESIASGVPIISWPRYVDQLVNSRYVSEVWRVGYDMKDICDRFVVQNMVSDLMKCTKNEFGLQAKQLAKLAMQSVEQDGSSYCALNRLINDIKSFKL